MRILPDSNECGQIQLTLLSELALIFYEVFSKVDVMLCFALLRSPRFSLALVVGSRRAKGRERANRIISQ